MAEPTVAFPRLGAMGRRMAARPERAGVALTVWDGSPGRCAAFAHVADAGRACGRGSQRYAAVDRGARA